MVEKAHLSEAKSTAISAKVHVVYLNPIRCKIATALTNVAARQELQKTQKVLSGNLTVAALHDQDS